MRREAPTPELVGDGPILQPGWAYGSVIRDRSGLFRMWYMGPPRYCEYYATSADGLTWELPKLDLVNKALHAGHNAFLGKYQRDGNGNWLAGSVGPEGFSVLDAEVQPHPAARMRFTALYLTNLGKHSRRVAEKGLSIAHSDDGIHWLADERNPVIPGWHDTNNCFMYDPDQGKYLIYGRPPVHVTLGTRANRLVSRMESDNLADWSSPHAVLDADERDADAFSLPDEGRLNDRGDVQETIVKIRGRDRQFYGITAFRYGDLYVGLAQVYHVPQGNTWLELVHSADGVDWRREALREPYIGPRPDTWEGRQVRPAMASPPVAVDDQLWIYYSGTPHSHHEEPVPEDRSIGVRALKKDRWVRYRSADAEAELLTHPIKPGERLWINASTERDGWLRVAVCDDWGRAHAGYGHEDCQPISGDALRHEVRWGDRVLLPKSEKEIRLRFYSSNASIYGFHV